MTSGELIQRKFQAWARRHALALQGSRGADGRPNYVLAVERNIFGGVLDEETRAAFSAGAGGELRGEIPSMSALHSSAAMAVNLFRYWLQARDWRTLAELLDVPATRIRSAAFERKYPVCADWKERGFTEPPHLDLGIDYEDGARVGVECKLFEPYGRLDHAPLKPLYLTLADGWADMPACHDLARQVAEHDAGFRRLGAAQLLRHMLGLRFGCPAGKARLIYLYFDAPGDEAAEHRAEVRRFQELIGASPVHFVATTVQEFILRAERHCRETHREYVEYLTERYL
jgi:hypothetical protein